MNSENINQTLAQLENSLNELDSARKQVEKVTEAANNLTNATSALANEVKLIADQIGNETNTILAEFSGKLSDFDQKLNINSDLSEKSIRDGIAKFSELTGTLKQKTENAIEELKSISVKTIVNQESEISKKLDSTLNAIEKETISVTDNFSKKLSESQEKFNIITDQGQKSIIIEVEKFKELAEDLKITSENAINEIKIISAKTIKEQEFEISKTIISLTGYCTEAQRLIVKIAELDFKPQLEKINTNISSIYTVIQNVKSQIESVEKSIGDKLIISSEKLTISLSNVQEEMNQRISSLIIEFENSGKKHQINSYITWGLIVIGIIAIILVD